MASGGNTEEGSCRKESTRELITEGSCRSRRPLRMAKCKQTSACGHKMCCTPKNTKRRKVNFILFSCT